MTWGRRSAIAGILAVVVGFIMGAYSAVEQERIHTKLEKRLFDVVNAGTMAKAKQVSCEIAFETTAKLTDEVNSKVEAFADKNKEVYGITILNGKKDIIHEYRNRIDQPKTLITRLEKEGSLNKKSAMVLSREKLAVAFSPVTINDGEVSAYVLYADSLSDYFPESRIVDFVGIGMIILAIIGVFLTTLLLLVYFSPKVSTNK